ncbi:MAG: proton-conducting transporter membrane subunit [Sulfolobales archaeon]
MNMESQILILILIYTILSYTIYSFSRRFRDTSITLLSIITGVSIAYLSIESRGVGGLIGLTGSITLLVSLAIAEIYKIEKRAMLSILGVYFLSTSLLILTTDSILRLFIYWEIVAMLMIGSLALYRSRDGYEAALKYAVICLPGSIIGLIGLILAVSETGSLTFPYILSEASIISKTLMVVGFGTEIALFPMYIWLPSVYLGMQPLLLAIEVVSILPATSYIIGVIASTNPVIAVSTSTLALLGSLIGSLSAIVQRDLRRLLAYSTLAHTGYMVLGISVGTTLATSYAILHMIAHGIPKASLLAVAFILLTRSGADDLKNLSSLGGEYRFISIGGALALLGLPPFLSFWSELYIFLGTFYAGIMWSMLAIVYAIVIILSTGYAFRIVYAYSGESTEKKDVGRDLSGILVLILFLLSLLLSPLQSLILQYFLGFSP